MTVVDGCAGFVSKPMGGSGDVIAQVVMAVPIRKELRPFWSVVLMAVLDEKTAFISWLVVCDKRLHFERENAEESPPSSAFSNTEMMNKFK
jgi:hypothetical protein